MSMLSPCFPPSPIKLKLAVSLLMFKIEFKELLSSLFCVGFPTSSFPR